MEKVSQSQSNQSGSAKPTNFSGYSRGRISNVDSEEKESEKDTKECPECSGDVIHDSSIGEVACEDCGLVLDDQKIDHGPDWRAYNQQERNEKERTGAPSTQMMHDKGLSTKISWQDRDAHGRSISGKQKKKMRRLRQWDERSRAKDSKERNLKHALGEIDRMSSALGIPKNVREMSSVVYQRCLEDDMIRGRSIEAMASASIHGACRQAGIPRTMDDVARVSRVEKKRISRAYRYISRELSLSIDPPKPTGYIPQVASDVEASKETRQIAEELLTELVESGCHSGKHPAGLAASALYAADQFLGKDGQKPDNLTQKQMANSVGVCEVTIRNRSDEMISLKDIEPPKVTIEVSDDIKQSEAMFNFINEMVNSHDIIDDMEMPFAPGRCRNALIADEENIENIDYGTWHQLDSGHYVNTKYCKRDKKSRIEDIAEMCDTEIEFAGW